MSKDYFDNKNIISIFDGSTDEKCSGVCETPRHQLRVDMGRPPKKDNQGSMDSESVCEVSIRIWNSIRIKD